LRAAATKLAVRAGNSQKEFRLRREGLTQTEKTRSFWKKPRHVVTYIAPGIFGFSGHDTGVAITMTRDTVLFSMDP
jgi:hypothetical protein